MVARVDEFNSDVIPTLFIAAIATRYFARRKKAESMFSSLLLLAVVALVVFGESFALEALSKTKSPVDQADKTSRSGS